MLNTCTKACKPRESLKLFLRAFGGRAWIGTSGSARYDHGMQSKLCARSKRFAMKREQRRASGEGVVYVAGFNSGFFAKPGVVWP